MGSVLTSDSEDPCGMSGEGELPCHAFVTDAFVTDDKYGIAAVQEEPLQQESRGAGFGGYFAVHGSFIQA